MPVLGFGIRPRGPSTRAMRPTLAIWSGVAIAASKSRQAALDLLDQVVTAHDVGAGGDRSLGLLAHREHRDARRLTRAVRQVHGAADHLVGLARVDAQPDRHLDGRVLLLRRRLLGELGRLERGVELVAVDLLGGFAVCLAGLAHCYLLIRGVVERAEAGSPTRRRPMRRRNLFDRDAHRPGGAGDDLGGLVDVVGVEVGLLGLGDLAHLIPGHLGDLGLVRLGRTLLHTGGLQQQPGGGRGLQLEREAAVLVDRDLHGDDVPALVLRRGVVRLAELHDVDAVLAERGADRRGGVGRSGLDLQLDQPGDLFLLRGHGSVRFPFWEGYESPRSWRPG